jgi:predicted Fe-Mo cluster-binding NifX family protein
MKKIFLSMFIFCSSLSAHWHHQYNVYSNKSTPTIVAIAADEKSEEAPIANTCGRAKYFHIYTIEKQKASSHEVIQNQWANQYRGSGIYIVNMLYKKNVEYLICQQTGPAIIDHLDHYHIEVIYDSGTVKNALEKFISKGAIR